MTFLSPIWLFALVPWSALVVSMLIGRRSPRDVPFLFLWPTSDTPPRTERRWALPPVAVWLALLSLLLAIISSAGPAIRRPGPRAITLIVDTGRSMSGLMPEATTGKPRAARFRQAMESLSLEMARLDADLRLTVVVTPGESTGVRSPADLPALAARLPATAMETGPELNRLVRQKLANSDDAIVVLTDQKLESPVGRVTAIAPPAGGNTVGIAAFSLRRSPRPQAMIRLHSSHWGGQGGTGLPSELRLRVTLGAAIVERAIPTPAIGQERDEFVDLPPSTSGSLASAELVGLADDLPSDDRANLTADIDWPAIEPAFAVGELTRLIGFYQKERPPGERSIHIRLVDRADALGSASGIILSANIGEPTRVAKVSAHPVSAVVGDWSKVSIRAGTRRDLPGGFIPILSDNRGPLVAVRQADNDGARQASLALCTDGWSDKKEYVEFFAGLFDWIGRIEAGGERMSAKPLTELTGDWSPISRPPGPEPLAYWPGIYERQEDSRRDAFSSAVGSLPVARVPPLDPGVLRNAIAAGEHRATIAPWILVACIAVMGLAAIVARHSDVKSGRPVGRTSP